MNAVHATDDYLNLYLSLPNLPPDAVLFIFFLTIARILPLMAIVPFLGSKNLPMAVRIMFGIALTAIFLPQNLLALKGYPFAHPYSVLILKELMIGTILGFIGSAPFFLAQMAGSLIDHSRGSSALQVTDPTTQSQTGPIGILYNYVLLAIFFSLSGPFLFFDGLANSYLVIPVGELFSPLFFQKGSIFWKEITTLAQSIFNLSLQLAAPSLIGILLTDLFLGIANRLAPQVQVVFLGISLKSWVGIAMMAAAWALIIRVMGNESISWIKELNSWIVQWK